jgi:transcriptional regulator with XRE-family HTH domain
MAQTVYLSLKTGQWRKPAYDGANGENPLLSRESGRPGACKNCLNVHFIHLAVQVKFGIVQFYLNWEYIMVKKHALKKTIGERLREMRKSLFFSQEKMAEYFEITRTAYTRNESGQTFPGYPVLYQLASTFGVSLDWLVCGKGGMFFKDKGNERETESEKEGGTGQAHEPEPVNPEHRELLDYMKRVPLLHYEVMAFFHRFKRENIELLETAINKQTRDNN